MPPEAVCVTVEGLTRDFGAVRALDRVSLWIERGEVRGIVGENGAGKSTLMKVLAGLVPPTAGRVVIRGHAVRTFHPSHATKLGVAMIHQELNLIDELSVADNIFLGRERTVGRTALSGAGFVSPSRTRAEASRLLKVFGFHLDPRAKVRDLSIAQKQLVEIAKALACDASVLIMDEPTAVLSEAESRALFGIIRALKGGGTAVLYISHRLAEVVALCDRVTIMRDGRVVETIESENATEAKLARLMVGRELTEQFPPHDPPDAATDSPPTLDVRGLAVPGFVHDATFAVRPGEVLGFAGLIGAGRTEMAEALVGLRPRTAGTIQLNGRPIAPSSPRHAANLGLAYLSEDRRGRGLVMGMGVVENTTLVSLARYRRGRTPIIHRRAEEVATRGHVERLAIKAGRRLRGAVDTLSGGNQQKVVLAKWLEIGPNVLILDEPTRGVDVGAKREVYGLIRALAAKRKACMFISSELPELLGLCDRIAVMRGGRVAGILTRDEFSEERVMHLAAGVGVTSERGGATGAGGA
ncbi:MAG: sugar ABC transporter ATP-binding protein [Phycisphaerales bacterium]